MATRSTADVDLPDRYRKLNTWIAETFGEKVYKVGLHGGFTCPNRDGTVGHGGCVFCNPAGSAPWDFDAAAPLDRQWARGVRHLGARHGARRFIAYFQDYTTTHADPQQLDRLWREALSLPGCVGLALCTRPDCLAEPVLDRLQALNEETMLWVEVGVQTIHDRTLHAMNRCHSQDQNAAALRALVERDIRSVGHVVLGLPGENEADMMATARFLADSGVWGAKIHNLQVVKDTELAAVYRAGRYLPMTREAYVDLVIGFLERLPPSLVIHRLCAEATGLTIAPDWSRNKMKVRSTIERELERRGARQGRRCGDPQTPRT